MKFKLLCMLLIMLSLSSNQFGQTEEESADLIKDAPNLFVDFDHIDMDYVKKNVNFVHYVVDRKQADIYVLVTTNDTGSDGRQYILTFFGQNDFESKNDTIAFYTQSNESDESRRSKFVKYLKVGLMSYMIETPLMDQFNITYNGKSSTSEKIDKWNYWIFKTEVKGDVSGEEYTNELDIEGDFDADRITEEWKIELSAGINYKEEHFNYIDTEAYSSFSKRWKFQTQIVKSVSDHWSVGGFAHLHSSTYRNIKLNYVFAPAIEYNYFPYSESTYRTLSVSYAVGYKKQFYFERTIYDKMEEDLFEQNFELNTKIIEPWGDIELSANFSNYLHDFSKNNLRVWADISLNLVKGFALEFGGGYSMIHDQLSLPAENLDIEDVLLRQSELATQYDYWFRYGISFTFGSMYNNVVNPRFGN